MKPAFSKEQLVEHIRSLGVSEGCTFMPHTSLRAIGPVDGGAPTVVSALLSAVGDLGTVVFPTFTFSYCDTRVWDRDNSASEMGSITEVARKWPGAHRSLHPIYSVVAIGARAEEFGACDDPNGVGDGSPFAMVEQAGGIYGLLGVGYNQGIVSGHRLEWQLGVSYRYLKAFPGTIRDGHSERHGDYSMLVRDLDQHVVTDFRKLGYMLEHVGAVDVGRFGWAIGRVVTAADFVSHARAWLQQGVPHLMHRTDESEAFTPKEVERLAL